MKYIGVISRYDESKGFGFIKSNQRFTVTNKDMFFHVSDCTFTPQINEVVLFDVGVYKGRAKAFDVECLSKEIDKILDKWSLYSENDKKFILSTLDKYYRLGSLRAKITEIASQAIHFEDAELQRFLLRIKENFLLEESNFEDDCKNIIDNVVSKVIADEYPDIGHLLSNGIPTLEECRNAIMLFMQDERTSIIFTHTIEDGYWRTHWKWDGAEDYYHEGNETYKFESFHKFALKGMTVNHDYSKSASGNFDMDMPAKNEEVLEAYCFLKNSRELWRESILVCKNRRDRLLHEAAQNILKSAQQLILEALSLYLSEKFPIYGQYLLTRIEKAYGKFWIDENNFDSLFLYNIDTRNINKQLINICQYVITCVNSIIAMQCTPLPDIHSIYSDSVEKDGMLLSADGSILYAVTDPELQEIIVPECVTHIMDGAFYRCWRLRNVLFLGSITHIGHGVFTNNQLSIDGDFSHIFFLGFNTSTTNLTINGETKPIKEWSYLYNKKIIDSTDITIKQVHIEHNDD